MKLSISGMVYVWSTGFGSLNASRSFVKLQHAFVTRGRNTSGQRLSQPSIIRLLHRRPYIAQHFYVVTRLFQWLRSTRYTIRANIVSSSGVRFLGSRLCRSKCLITNVNLYNRYVNNFTLSDLLLSKALILKQIYIYEDAGRVTRLLIDLSS